MTDLSKLLRNNYNEIENDNMIYFIIRGIVNGMIYIHSKDIIHRDLSSNNILITSFIIIIL